MPHSISYEDGEGGMKEWTIPSLVKWISGEALPVEFHDEVTAEIVVPIPEGVKVISVNVFNSGVPRVIAEEFVDLDVEFRVFLTDILTKFLKQDLITQLVDTTNLDFSNYHGSWDASWMEGFAATGLGPYSLLNTSGLYILLPDDPQKVKTDGLRVMYRQAQRYNMKHYDAIDKQVGLINLAKRNEIVTIIFPPLAPSSEKQAERGNMFKSTFENSVWAYDSEPISQSWLKEQLDDHSVLMILGVKSKTPVCLNWNLHQLNQFLSKITLSSRAS